HDVTSATNAARDISARFGRKVGARQSGSTKQSVARRVHIGRLLAPASVLCADHDSDDSCGVATTFDRMGQAIYLFGTAVQVASGRRRTQIESNYSAHSRESGNPEAPGRSVRCLAKTGSPLPRGRAEKEESSLKPRLSRSIAPRHAAIDGDRGA